MSRTIRVDNINQNYGVSKQRKKSDNQTDVKIKQATSEQTVAGKDYVQKQTINPQDSQDIDNVQNSELPSDGKEKWEKTINEYIDMLKKSFPSVTFEFRNFKNQQELAQYALSQKSGFHFIISPEYLEGAAADPENSEKLTQFIKKVMSIYNAGNNKNISSGVVIGENGEAALWSVPEKQTNLPPEPVPKEETPIKKAVDWLMEGNLVKYYKEGNKKITEIKTDKGTLRFVIAKSLGYTPARDLSRLTKAMSPRDVGAFIAGIGANMSKIRSDKSYDKKEIKAALAQMDGVIRRARTKINKLKDEERIEILHRHTAEKQKAERLAEELRRKKTARISKEYAQINEKFGPLIGQSRNRRNPYDEEYDTGDYIPEMPVMPMAPVMPATIPPAYSPTDVGSVNIQMIDMSI